MRICNSKIPQRNRKYQQRFNNIIYLNNLNFQFNYFFLFVKIVFYLISKNLALACYFAPVSPMLGSKPPSRFSSSALILVYLSLLRSLPPPTIPRPVWRAWTWFASPSSLSLSLSLSRSLCLQLYTLSCLPSTWSCACSSGLYVWRMFVPGTAASLFNTTFVCYTGPRCVQHRSLINNEHGHVSMLWLYQLVIHLALPLIYCYSFGVDNGEGNPSEDIESEIKQFAFSCV